MNVCQWQPLLLCQDGLVSPTDAALRDVSAASLREFVLWSIKQSTPQVKRHK